MVVEMAVEMGAMTAGLRADEWVAWWVVGLVVLKDAQKAVSTVVVWVVR